MNRSTFFSLRLLLMGAIVFFLLETLGCGSSSPPPPRGFKYQYVYSMVQPEQSLDLVFTDPGFEIRFQIDEGAIGFELKNSTGSPLTIDWPRAAIGVGAKLSPVRAAATYGVDSSLQLKVVVVPAGGVVRDFVLPRGNLVRRGARTLEVDLFPTADLNSVERQKSIANNVGKKLTLFMPVEVDGTRKNYSFEFQVSAVDRIAWKNYRAPQRTPLEPPKKMSPSTMDIAVAAVITAGMAGLAAMVVTSKKDPRND